MKEMEYAPMEKYAYMHMGWLSYAMSQETPLRFIRCANLLIN
jgi:hypothetical protein